MVISDLRISATPNKLQLIEKHLPPKSIKELRSFLGICSFLRGYIPNFSFAAQPLFNLLKKTENFRWESEQQTAFEDLKHKCASAITLSHPKVNKQLVIQTDSSMRGIAGVMFQYHENNNPNIIAVASRSLKGPEVHYSATEIEALAIVWILKKWATYLLGQEFKVITDHKALTFLQHCYPAVDRLRRWILFLQQFNFSIEYIEGKNNNVADYLSRTFPNEHIFAHNEKVAMIMSTLVIKELQQQIFFLQKLQQEDLKCQIIQQKCSKNFIMHNKILFVLEKNSSFIFLPEKLVPLILKFYHDDHGHYGYNKTAKLIKTFFRFAKMKTVVKNYVKTCNLCQRVKPFCMTKVTDFRSVTADKPGMLISSDIWGPLPSSRGGMKYVLVMLDVCSKYVKLFEMKRATTKAVLSAYDKYFNQEGKPIKILSDLGTQFSSSVYKKN